VEGGDGKPSRADSTRRECPEGKKGFLKKKESVEDARPYAPGKKYLRLVGEKRGHLKGRSFDSDVMKLASS